MKIFMKSEQNRKMEITIRVIEEFLWRWLEKIEILWWEKKKMEI